MTESKQYSSVQEMVDDTCSPEFSEQFRELQAATRIRNSLTVARVRAGLTEGELCQRLGWTIRQLRHRVEWAMDADMRYGHIVAYAEACGATFNLSVRDELQGGE